MPSDRRGRRPGDDHRFVALCWLYSSDGEVQRIGSALHDLQGARTEADYRLSEPRPEDPDEASFWVSEADRLIRRLGRAFEDGSRCQRIATRLQSLERDGTLEALLDDRY